MNVSVQFHFLHILHVQTVPSLFFVRVLKIVKFSEGFMWYDKEFPTFGPRYFKLFIPNFTWFDFGISRFSLYFSCVEMSFIKLGLISFKVLEISIHKPR